MKYPDRVETINGYKYIRLRSRRLISFWDAVGMVDNRHTDLGLALARMFKLADEDFQLETAELRLDRLEEHINALRVYLADLRRTQSKRERIAALRSVEGRTPEEAAEFLRKADELEAGLK